MKKMVLHWKHLSYRQKLKLGPNQIGFIIQPRNTKLFENLALYSIIHRLLNLTFGYFNSFCEMYFLFCIIFILQSKGSEALNALQYLCSNDVNIPIGGICHTGMQNDQGGYENDCSLARLAENQ